MLLGDFNAVLSTLARTPALLSDIAEQWSPQWLRARGSKEQFSYLEQVWHLADLEVDGYGRRIQRLLKEEEPILEDFDGAKVATERCYFQRDLWIGLRQFEKARRDNVARLQKLSLQQWGRGGTLQGIGPLKLSDVPKMMHAHDLSHFGEIAELMEELLPDHPKLAELRSILSEAHAAADSDLASTSSSAA